MTLFKDLLAFKDVKSQFFILFIFCFGVSFSHAVPYVEYEKRGGPFYKIEEPLIEWGIFIGHGSLADYPTSDQSRVRTIPFPLLKYRGKIFRSDDSDGMRFRFLSNERFDLDLSFGGSFAADSENNEARKGMPALDWTGEVGPRLLYYIYKDSEVAKIRVGLPIRGTLATDFKKWYGVGYVIAPTFQVEKYHFPCETCEMSFSITANFLSRSQADYFFQVEPQFATTERAAYNAKEGYLGTDVGLSGSVDWDKIKLILGTRYSNYSGSVNKSSYLHRNDVSWSYFIGFGWLLFESETRGYE